MEKFLGLFLLFIPIHIWLGKGITLWKHPLYVGGFTKTWDLFSVILPFHYYHRKLIDLARKSAVISSRQILLTYGVNSWTPCLFQGTSVWSRLALKAILIPPSASLPNMCVCLYVGSIQYLQYSIQYKKVHVISPPKSATFVSCERCSSVPLSSNQCKVLLLLSWGNFNNSLFYSNIYLKKNLHLLKT